MFKFCFLHCLLPLDPHDSGSEPLSHICFVSGETWQKNYFLSGKAVNLIKWSWVNNISTLFEREHCNSQENEFCIWFQLAKHKLYLIFCSPPFLWVDDSQLWKGCVWGSETRKGEFILLCSTAVIAPTFISFARVILYLKDMKALTLKFIPTNFKHSNNNSKNIQQPHLSLDESSKDVAIPRNSLQPLGASHLNFKLRRVWIAPFHDSKTPNLNLTSLKPQFLGSSSFMTFLPPPICPPSASLFPKEGVCLMTVRRKVTGFILAFTNVLGKWHYPSEP